MAKSAVVFAYHDIGVRCLEVLKKAGVDIKLVVTHFDNPKEKIWFGSVAKKAEELGLSVLKVNESDMPEIVKRTQALKPDLIFSFYFRFMLPAEVLKSAKVAGFNMHGSLLPKYRGRVPINWAVLHGEKETGATLHVMEIKPDAGDIVDQAAVDILPDDTAVKVFHKVTEAAVNVMQRTIPSILKGSFPRQPNELAKGSYFTGRKPEDGKIHPEQGSERIYNLIRAVGPPYPGAYLETALVPKLFVYTGRLIRDPQLFFEGAPSIFTRNNKYFLQVEKGAAIEILTCGGADEIEIPAEKFFKENAAIKLPWRL
jgi:methionyl-tRNA formyltransferase